MEPIQSADLSKLAVTKGIGSIQLQGGESLLIFAAESGNPDMVREVLRYHPTLEMVDREGRTALFRAAEYQYGDEDGARVECVRLLAQTGANVNARDNRKHTAT